MSFFNKFGDAQYNFTGLCLVTHISISLFQGVTVEEICSSIQTMPQLLSMDYDPKLLMITCSKSHIDEIQVFMVWYYV